MNKLPRIAAQCRTNDLTIREAVAQLGYRLSLETLDSDGMPRRLHEVAGRGDGWYEVGETAVLVESERSFDWDEHKLAYLAEWVVIRIRLRISERFGFRPGRARLTRVLVEMARESEVQR